MALQNSIAIPGRAQREPGPISDASARRVGSRLGALRRPGWQGFLLRTTIMNLVPRMMHKREENNESNIRPDRARLCAAGGHLARGRRRGHGAAAHKSGAAELAD